MKNLNFLLAGGLLALMSCETQQTVQQANTETPGYKMQEVRQSQGQEIYEKSCSTCHNLYPVESRTVTEWAPILAQMVKRAKLDAKQTSLVQDYVFANAKK